MSDIPGEVLRHLGEIDPTMLEGVVDTSPTLETWASVGPTLADMNFVMGTMAAAYDAAVYSIGRNLRTPGIKPDTPVGAAIGDPDGYFYSGFAQDQESGDPKAHAEVMAIRSIREMEEAMEIEIPLGGLTLAATVEPCPSCLDELGEAGIKRVVYGTSRRELEAIGFVKPHSLKAAELVKRGRILSGKFDFEFFQIPNRAVQSACLELFVPFQRDMVAETLTFNADKVSSTRFGGFVRDMDEQPLPDRAPQAENERLVKSFSSVLDSFYRKLER